MTSSMSGQGGAGFRSQVGLNWDYKFVFNASGIGAPGSLSDPNMVLFTVPAQTMWEPVFIAFTFTTDATAGVRSVGLQFKDPANTGYINAVLLECGGGYVHNPSTTVRYVFQAAYPTIGTTTNSRVYRALPHAAVTDGMQLCLQVENGQPGDACNTTEMCVREYRGSTKVSFL